MIKFRNLTADEIECRVQQVTDNGLILLLYKNARCDMNILDETVGSENWQREHYECKGNLFCRVGILKDSREIPDNAKDIVLGRREWIWKSDCGTESNTEAEKGEASDSFKRACVNWGIGRELYTAPLIWIPAVDKNGRNNYNAKNKNGKIVTKDKFAVEKITISEDKKIIGFSIVNTSIKERVFMYAPAVTKNGN